MIHLVPQYRQQLKQHNPIVKSVPKWITTAIQSLQGCYACTDWSVLVDDDLSRSTERIIDYLSFCQGLCIQHKDVVVYPNDKPWFNRSIRSTLLARDLAFRSGDAESFKKSKYEARRSIKLAKRIYSQKLESDMQVSNDSRQLWQAVNKIAPYKSKSNSKAIPDDPNLPDELNEFYARFDRAESPPTKVPCDESPSFVIDAMDTRRIFARLNVRKAAGPDGITPRLLRTCANELAGIFTMLFNWSLRLCTVPDIFKRSVIIPIPKRSPVSCLNDYRPVALTSVIGKSFERLVLEHLKRCIPDTLDPFPFAYRSNRSTDDAVSITLHNVLKHLCVKNARTYARILFIDFSSAFNTILPQKLFDKLSALGISTSMCNWILDFLSNRPQVVKIGANVSQELVLNTGTAQGCVLSPKLYSLFTHDCVSTSDDCLIVKFADDTTVSGLIRGSDETSYRNEIQNLTNWCSDNNLELNVRKTKELIIDFRRGAGTEITPLIINGSEVEIVDCFKFLGIHISNDLGWSANIDHCVKKAQQRLYFLRRLKGFGLSTSVLLKFYRAVVESVLTLSITVWYGSATVCDRKRLERVVKTAGAIIGSPLPSVDAIYRSRLLKKAGAIIGDSSHPANHLFHLMRSGARYRSLPATSKRALGSTYPSAVRELNLSLSSR